MAGTDGLTGLPPDTAAKPDRYEETLRINMMLRQAISAGFEEPIGKASGKLLHFVLDNFDHSGATVEDLRPYLPPKVCTQVLTDDVRVLRRVKEGVIPVAVMRQMIGMYHLKAPRLDIEAMNRLTEIYYERILEGHKLNKQESTVETLLELAMRKPDPYDTEGDGNA